ncbi:squalene synthase HpnC [Actinomadura sp. NEAU-AAG5]|uniref:Squalene synthase HpnC n=1 Tax=Actinomadura litoris TaxID=2678616 RepID=A0A7K1KW04_9ACTN|nr:squalene synthase HpnC [Actinomadura litoris]
MVTTEPPWSAREHERGLDALARRENFPVAARLLPGRHRAHLRAVYGFARLVDDIGDEAPGAHRVALLDSVDADLDLLYKGRAPVLPQLRRLAETVHARGIPQEPFRRLVQANRRDQEVTRYASFDELLGYCVLSANPVGRIVLHVFGAEGRGLEEASDRVCTALQVIEHCQDVAEDFRAGRIYLPGEDLRRFGCAEDDLSRAVTPTRLRGVLALESNRARDLLDRGAAPLMAGLRGWARIAVAGYVAGGRAALAALVRGRYDVLARTPRPRGPVLLANWASALGGGRR